MRAILKSGALTAGLSEVDRSDNRKSFKVVKIPSKTNCWKVREMSRKPIQGNVFALIGCQAHDASVHAFVLMCLLFVIFPIVLSKISKVEPEKTPFL